jgi:flagellar hook-associated protein 1 FlgK
MWNFAIGLSGLDAARKGLDVIGNNIANAATEGYHNQRVDLTPAYSQQDGTTLIGGGVDVAGVSRIIDNLLEKEIVRQQSSLEQVSQESDILRTVEAAFGEIAGSSGLNAAIDQFFGALSDLAAHPDQVIQQTQAASAADTMAAKFRMLGRFLTDLQMQIGQQAEETVKQINTLTGQIAQFNDNIERVEMGGGQANNLRDQRDHLINDLGQLIGVETQARENGVVDVTAGGVPVVMGASTIELEVGLNDEGLLGISPAGAYNYDTTIEGGKLGALVTLKNTTIADIQKGLDDLARAIMQQLNDYHVQGVGSDGSFTELTGWTMTSETIADFVPPVGDGAIYIRVTDTSTGEITRHQIDINPASDSLSDVATAISAIPGLSASVTDSRLNIQADAGYKFDFIPAVLPEPTASNLTGTSPPAISVSGIYTGSENQTFTFTAVGSGAVGNGTLVLQVTDGDGKAVATLNVGSGYAAGDVLDVGNGIKITVGVGDLVDGDSFEVDAFADTDESGLLAAVGINTLFSGAGASDMAVCSDISGSPRRMATALGADMTDNANILRMASLRDKSVSDLDSLTAGEFYRRLVTDIGEQVSIRQIRQDNAEVLVQSLTNQQAEISGVDINEQAAQMIVFQQMFQAMAKYLNVVQTSIQTIMDMV